MGNAFVDAMPIVARELLGQPNSSLSTKSELRFGKNGSMSVDVVKGVFHDHETDDKGGVLDLIALKTGREKQDAIEWMHEHGIELSDSRGPSAKKTNGSNGAGYRASEREEAPLRDEPPDLEEAAPAARESAQRKISAIYPYQDGDGGLLYEVVRYEPKSFSQRRPAPGYPDAYVWGLSAGTYVRHDKGKDFYKLDDKRAEEKGWRAKLVIEDEIPHGLFNFPEVLQEMRLPEDERRILTVAEGEKDCLTLAGFGLLATTNSGGAKHWQPHLAEYLRGADVVILTDNDKAGRERGDKVGKSLQEIAKRIRLIDWAKHWPGAPEKADITRWRDEAGGTKEKLLAIIDKLPNWEPAPYDSKFGAIAWRNLAAYVGPYDYLIHNFLPAGERTMIYGAPSGGKSYAAMDIALAVARGVKYEGRIVKRCGVVYCAFEGGKGFANRVEAYRQHYGLKYDDDVPFVILTKPADIFGDEQAIKDLRAEILHHSSTLSLPLGLVVYDTVSASSGAMEDGKGGEVGKYLTHGNQIIEGLKAATLYVHHVPKNATELSPRGSGKWSGDMEATILVSAAPENAIDDRGLPIRVVTLVKLREGEGNKVIKKFVLPQRVIMTDADGENVTACVVLAPGAEAPSEEGARKYFDPTPNEEAAIRALLKALEKYGETPKPDLGDPLPSTVGRIVSFDNLRTTFEASHLPRDNNESDKFYKNKIKNNLARAIGSLTTWGVVDKHVYTQQEQVFWWTGRPVKGIKETFPKTSPNTYSAKMAAGVDLGEVSPDDF